MVAAKEELVIVIEAKDRLSPTLKRIGKGVSSFISKAVRGFKKLASVMRAVGSAILKVLGPLGLLVAAFSGVRFIIGAVSDARAFSRVMAEVETIVPAATNSIESMTAETLELAKALGLNESIVGRGLYEAISAGAKAGSQATNLLRISAELGLVSVTDTASAVDLLTTAVNAYGFTQREVQGVADIFFKTVEKGKVRIPELSGTIGRLIPLAAALGVSLEDVTAAIATLTAGGLPAEIAITSIRAALAGIASPSKEVADLAKEAGLQFDALTFQGRTLVEVFDEIRVSSEKLGRRGRQQLVDLFPNLRAQAAGFALAGNQAEKFADTLIVTSNAANSIAVALDKFTARPAFRVEKAFNALRIESIKLGFAIIEAVDTAIEKAGGLAALEQDIGIITRSLAAVLREAIFGMGELIGRFNQFVESSGGPEKITQVLTAALETFARVTKALIFGVVDTISTLIKAILLVPETIAAALSEIPGLGIATKKEIDQEIKDLIALREQVAQGGGVDFQGVPADFQSALTIEKLSQIDAALIELQKDFEEAPRSVDALSEAFTKLRESADFTATGGAFDEVGDAFADFREAIAALGPDLPTFAGLLDAVSGSMLTAGAALRAVVIARGGDLELLVKSAAAHKDTLALLAEETDDTEALRSALERETSIREELLGIQRQLNTESRDTEQILLVEGVLRRQRIEDFIEEQQVVGLLAFALRALTELTTRKTFVDREAGIEEDAAKQRTKEINELLQIRTSLMRALTEDVGLQIMAVREAAQADRDRIIELARTSEAALAVRDSMLEMVDSLEEANLASLRLQESAQELSEQGLLGGIQFGLIEATESFSSFEAGVDLARSGIGSFTSGVGQFVQTVASGAKTAKEAFKDFAVGFLANIASMIAQLLALQAVLLILRALGFSLPGGGTTPVKGLGQDFIKGVDPDALAAVKAQGFAGGGIIKGGIKAMSKIPGFAHGGIVTSPTLAAIGEGGQNEAVVPIGNGREIGVDLRGQGGDVNIFITAFDSKDVSEVLFENRGSLLGLVAEGMKERTNFAARMSGRIGL